MRKDYQYAIIDREAGNEISYHNTMEEVLDTIASYEKIDREEGTYSPNFYDWKFINIENE